MLLSCNYKIYCLLPYYDGKLQLYAIHVCMGTVLLLDNVSVIRDGKDGHVKFVSHTKYILLIIIIVLNF